MSAKATRPDHSNRHADTIKLATYQPEEPIRKRFAELKYDYEQIAEEHRDKVRDAAVGIRMDAETAHASWIRIGERLVKVKEMLPHGQFTDWLEKEFKWSERSAQGFMSIYREYGGDDERAKTALLFSQGALLLLAAPSTPDDVREEMEARAVESGVAPTRTEIREAIIESRGESPAQPEESPFATVAELQMVVSDWVRSEFYWLENEIKGLEEILAKGGKARVPGLLERLTPAKGVAAYRPENLRVAIENVLAARRRQQTTIAAAPKPPPPPPAPPSSWQLHDPIQKWVSSQKNTPKEQHALLKEIDERGEKHPDYAALTATLPERWGKRALNQAIKDILEQLLKDFGKNEWDLHQVPSGQWYAVNKGRYPVATPLYATQDEALAHHEQAKIEHRQLYAEIAAVLTDKDSWRDSTINSAGIEQLWEIYLGLEARAKEKNPPPFVRTRLERVQKRLADARRLLLQFAQVDDGWLFVINRTIAQKLQGAAAAMTLNALTLVEQAILEEQLLMPAAFSESKSDGPEGE